MWKGNAVAFTHGANGNRDILVQSSGAQDGRAPREIGSNKDSIQLIDLPQAPSFLAFFEDRALAVQWSLGYGDWDRAKVLLGELQVTFAGTDSELIHLRLELLTAMVTYDCGDYPQAALLLVEVCPEFEKRDMKPELWQARRFLGWCAARLGWPGEQQETLRRQTQTLMRELADSLPPTQRAIYLLNKWTVEEMYLAAEIDQLTRAKLDLEKCPWYRRPWRRLQLWRQLHRFLTQLDQNRRLLAHREAGGGNAAVAEPPVLSWWRRLWRHPWRQATLSFLVLPDRVFASRAGWLALDFAVGPMTRLRVRELIARWHQHVSRLQDQDLLDEVSTELATGLQLPQLLAALPRRIRRLTFVPDDSLHGFPFAAWCNNGRFLFQDYAITITFDRTAPRITTTDRPIIQAVTAAVTRGIFANDRFPCGIAALSNAREEVEHLARWLAARGAPPHLLIDDSADKSTLLNFLGKADFAHIACHGIFQPDRPDASGLVLIPRPEQVEILSLRDLSHLEGNHLQHLTLANCWSADNFILPGRWIISLPETLGRIGVKSVLGCLWEIDDEVGRAFHKRFYDYLARLPRDEALRATQMDCLQNRLSLPKERKTENLFYWGGYQLYGDHRRLSWRVKP
jgi:CHAT domain-containing protein